MALAIFPLAGRASTLFDHLAQSAPKLNQHILKSALDASQCALSSGLSSAKRLAVIDFSLPSTAKRLWLFDLENGHLLLNELVAHGKNSGSVSASHFSNEQGSHQSSIGLFRGAETYSGKHGYSLRLDGLEPGINDNARDRAIVIHGASYVNQDWIDRQGRIGRSHGCPAVDKKIIREVVDHLKGGQLVFTYYPDQKWLHSSGFLNCDRKKMAKAPRPQLARNS